MPPNTEINWIMTLVLGLSLAGCCDDTHGDEMTTSMDPEDLVVTECAVDLIGYTNSIIEAINAIAVPLESRRARMWR
jgi:hypothetical protein